MLRSTGVSHPCWAVGGVSAVSRLAAMTTPAGRGRGFASRNRDLKMLGSLVQSENQQSGNDSSSNITKISQPERTGLARQSSRDSFVSQYQDLKNFEDVDENFQNILYIDEKYSHVIQQINLLSTSDDGILINQKLKHIEGVLIKECPQPQALRCVMDAIASASILDTNTASKVSKMMCSVSFSRVQIHQLRLYTLFMSALRDKIDALELSLNGADQYLVNVSTLLTGIYTETKILQEEELNMLAQLIVQVFFDLIKCNTVSSLRTLNIQLMQYGRNLYAILPDRLNEISVAARKLMISREPPPHSCRIWLSLLADQCLYHFESLPQYLQSFYGEHVDDSCQDNAHNLEKMPRSARNYDNGKDYRKPIKSDSSDKWSTTSGGDKLSKYQSSSKDDVFDEKVSLEDPAILEYYSSETTTDHVKERKPRPILGAGSRIAHQTKPNNENQFADVQNFSSYSNENVEISKLCVTVPPPNFIPKTIVLEAKSKDVSNSGKPIITAGQDTGNFWNYPPPKTPPTAITKRAEAIAQVTSALNSRLDLNSWRQAGKNSEQSIESNETYEQKTDTFDIDPSEVVNRLNKSEDKSYESGHSYWNKKRLEDNENDKNAGRNGGSRQCDRNKKDWTKKEAEEKDTNWRRRGSEDKKQNSWKKPADNAEHSALDNRLNKVRLDSTSKNEDDLNSETGAGDKKSNRRGSGRTKRDFLEAPRKATYWTHDDRCDKDYNE